MCSNSGVVHSKHDRSLKVRKERQTCFECTTPEFKHNTAAWNVISHLFDAGRESMMVFRPENTKSRCQSSFFDAIGSHWHYVASLKSKIVTKMLAVMRCINSALTSQHYSIFTLIIRYCWCLNRIQEDAECWSQCIPCCGLFYMHKNSRTMIDYMWMRLWHNV